MNLRFLVASWLSIGASLLVQHAHASPTFPAVVQAWNGGSASCATCHLTGDATPGALSVFGSALQARGARGSDDGSLRRALEAMRQDAVDSDGDGARDVDEISWGGDPNVADVPSTVPEEPRYGLCGIGRDGPASAWLVGGALVCAVALARRRHP